MAAIREGAQSRGHDVQMLELDAQSRSGGSRLHAEWVLRPLGPVDGVDRGRELRSPRTDSPQEMGEILAARNARGCGARGSAGRGRTPSAGSCSRPTCGSGSGHGRGRTSRRWHEGAPARSLWAMEEDGFGQVGCVYTAQGFEYDWSGVILALDLVWRGGRFVSYVRSSKDPADRGKSRRVSTPSCATSARCC